MAMKLAVAHDMATEVMEEVFKSQCLFTHFFLSATRTSDLANGTCTISPYPQVQVDDTEQIFQVTQGKLIGVKRTWTILNQGDRRTGYSCSLI